MTPFSNRPGRSIVALGACALSAIACAGGGAPFEARSPVPDPDEARFVTEDIPRFWAAYDAAIDGTEAELRDALQTMYLDPGTPGVEGFTPNRIQSAEHLAKVVRAQRPKYEAARANSLAVAAHEPAIREGFRELKRLHPDAVFPDVYFVIGGLNSGGTSTPKGIIMGMEMEVNRPETIVALVTHEAVHYIQEFDRSGEIALVDQIMIEGFADFVGQMASGGNINAAALEYARAHEAELWRELEPALESKDFKPWLYVRDPAKLNGRPPDVGYAMGYLIAESLYESAADKPAALREIVECRDPRAILARSGYGAKFAE